MTAVYIADIEMRAVPIKKNSRLQPIVVRKEKYPLLLDENKNIVHECFKRVSKTLLKDKASNYDRYKITISISNVKFSTKVYGS